MPAISFNDLLKSLSKENTPGNIAQLEKYLHAKTGASSQPGLLIRLLVDAIDQLPGPVEDGVYAILCDKNNPLRQMVSSTLTTQGTSIATTVLIAGLGTLVTGPAAGLIAGIIVKLIADSADQDFSEEINRARAERRLAQMEKGRAEEKKPARRKAAESPAGGEKPARKKPAGESAAHQKTARQEGETGQHDGAKRPTVKKSPAKKPAEAAQRAVQRPAASGKRTPATSKTTPSEKPVRKSTGPAKPAAKAKTSKKEKHGEE